MIKLYNTQKQITSSLANFFKNIFAPITKPQLKVITAIIFGMIQAESVVTTDIVKKLKDDFSLVSPSSTVRRFERFFNNPSFHFYDFYNHIISHVISLYKPRCNNVYISFDHMYCRNSFTIFLFSLKIGKQGIPLWFRCFKGVQDPDAFKSSLIQEGIAYVHNLFTDKKDCNLIFLADRWFPNCQTMHFIDSLGDFYCIRAKSNFSIHIFDNFPNSKSISHISDISPLRSHSKHFYNVSITEQHFKTNLAVSKSSSHKEPFFILTNGDPTSAIKHYGYRFGSIEFIFKNQKSNGFYLESSKMRNINAFSSLFTIACISLLWLTIIGVDYSKNQKGIKSTFKFRASRHNGGRNKRVFSLFNTGLFFFNLAFESPKYVLLKFNFLLYDV